MGRAEQADRDDRGGDPGSAAPPTGGGLHLADPLRVAQVLDGLSSVLGCPVVLTDPQGCLVAHPPCHPGRCPLVEGTGLPPAECPPVREAAGEGQGREPGHEPVWIATYQGAPHAVAPISIAGVVRGFAVVDGGFPRPGPRPAVPLERLKTGVALAALFAASLAGEQPGAAPRPGGGPAADPVPAPTPTLWSSAPEAVRRAVAEGWITQEGLGRLREEFGLTWREVEIFILYYFCSEYVSPDAEGNARRALARYLQISDGTLRVCLTGIRSKLGLQSRRGALSVLSWARAEGIVPRGLWPF